jgi:lysophospholipase L1-like esterase
MMILRCKNLAFTSLLTVLFFSGLVSCTCAAESGAFSEQDRVVNLGDSITDGQTYALLMQQALREAGKAAPVCFGAGIGGDVAPNMFKRLQRDVLVHKPTWVMFSSGINDLGLHVKLEDYEASVRAIAERLKKENVKLLVLTTSNIRGGAHGEKLQEFHAAARRAATENGGLVAEVFERMEDARKKDLDLWETDGCHLNFEGYRAMTRAVLDAVGYRDVAVPAALKCQPIVGIVRSWKIAVAPEKDPPLTDARATELIQSAEWKSYTLPEETPLKHWWHEQERSRGFAMSLKERFGGSRYYGLCEIQSAARKAYINTGGELKSVWLNGVKIPFESHGWHAGDNRIPVELRAGANTILIETGGRFFLSVTDTNTW